MYSFTDIYEYIYIYQSHFTNQTFGLIKSDNKTFIMLKISFNKCCFLKKLLVHQRILCILVSTNNLW